MNTVIAKKFAFLLLILVSLPAFWAFTPAEESAPFPPRWERLGSRKVNFRLDRDEIPVTVREGVFSGLKLKITGSPINLHRVIVHYRNGQKQSLNVRMNIPRGGETRVLDLKGNKRVIQKVVFYYDTKNLAAGRGTIHLWGKR
ncbi:MAG: hypothetical protein AAFP89_04940 [Bacteroidota bacterium]